MNLFLFLCVVVLSVLVCWIFLTKFYYPVRTLLLLQAVQIQKVQDEIDRSDFDESIKRLDEQLPVVHI